MSIRFLLLVTVLPLMSSCTGIQLTYSDNRHHMDDGSTKARKGDTGVEGKTLTQCAVYVLPANRPTPQVPLGAFNAVRKEDHRSREAVLLDYIEQLRTHIRDTTSDHTSQYKSYLTNCKATSE